MTAGQGFKTFTTGEVLTAGDVNGYLMQGINVFASNAARDAAITAPAEGQFAFTKDTNSLWYYDGAAWVASGAAGDIEGVTAGVGISGGGTSGTVTVTNSMATAIDAKGDLVPGTGADTFARLQVGANDTILVADSSTATGLKWAAPASGGLNGYTLINTGGTALTGAATITVTGISNQQSLYVFIQNASSTNANAQINLTINGDTGANYSWAGTKHDAAANARFDAVGVGYFAISGNSSVTTSSSTAGVLLLGTKATSGFMFMQNNGMGSAAGGANQYGLSTNGNYACSAAVTSINVICTNGNFDAGTVFVYGMG